MKVLDKTVKHTNFYENIEEARMRLVGTIIVYDHGDEPPGGKEPYQVFAITNHKKDGKFRIYLQKLGPSMAIHIPELSSIPPTSAAMGDVIDKWMEQDANKGKLLRKNMDSKHFNNFRPFPLGMCNTGGNDGRCFYLERQPQRHREQGLTSSMMTETCVSLSNSLIKSPKARELNFFSEAFRSCVRGEYPLANEVLEALCNPKIKNEAVGFHRLFALIRGPMDLIFLGYKDKVIGLLPHGDFSEIKLGKEFGYTREAVEDLKLFERVIQK